MQRIVAIDPRPELSLLQEGDERIDTGFVQATVFGEFADAVTVNSLRREAETSHAEDAQRHHDVENGRGRQCAAAIPGYCIDQTGTPAMTMLVASAFCWSSGSGS